MGSTFAQGLAWGERQAALGQEHKQALSDAELEQNIGDANENIAGFRKQLSDQQPGTVGHEQARLGLQQAIQARTQLFHPDRNPTAMAKFGHMLLDHVPGHQAAPPPIPVNAPTISATPAMSASAPVAPLPMAAQPAAPVDRSVIPMNRPAATADAPASSIPALGEDSLNLPQGPAQTVQGPQTPQQLKAQAQANLIAGSTPGPAPGSLTPDEEHAAARVRSGLDSRAPIEKPEGGPLPKGSLVPGRDAAGNPVMGYADANGLFHPVAGTTVAPPKAPPQSNSEFSVLLRAMNPEVTDGKYTAEQVTAAMEEKKRRETADTDSSHEVPVYDEHGNASLLTLHSKSKKSFGGSGRGAPSSAGNGTEGSKPGGKTRTVGTSAGGGSSRLTPLPGVHRNTPAQSAAEKDYDGAVKLSSFADQVAKAPTAQSQKQLALKLIKESAGRVNMQEFDIMTKRAGIANTLEAWANSVTTGALPNEIFANLVDAAHKNKAAADDARKAAYGKEDTPSPGDLKSQAQGNTVSDDEFLQNVGKP